MSRFVGVFSRLKDVIWNNIGGLLSSDRKSSYVDSFVKLLEDNGVDSSVVILLRGQFVKNLSYISDINNLEQVSNVMWLTIISNVEKSLMHVSSLDDIGVRSIFVYGLPGCGKSSFLVKYFRSVNFSKIRYVSDNSNNVNLISSWSSVSLLDSHCAYEFFESSNVSFLSSCLESDYKLKVFVCIDVNTSFEVFKDLFNSVNVDYVVFTKVDQLVNVGLILSLSFISKAKILFLVNGEIGNLNNDLVSGSSVVNILAKKILKKNISSGSELQSLIDSQKNLIDLNTYRIYLQFINDLDRDKLSNLIEVYKQASAYMKLDELDKYKQYLDQIKNPDTQRKIAQQTLRQMYIIDSMNKLERRNPSIISNVRRKRIIFGSGTDLDSFYNTIKSFEQYKQTVQKLNLQSKNYEDIIKNI